MDYLVAPEFYKEEGYPDSYDTQTSSRMQSKLFEGARQDGVIQQITSLQIPTIP